MINYYFAIYLAIGISPFLFHIGGRWGFTQRFQHFLNAYKYSIQTLNYVTLNKKSLYFNVLNDNSETSKGRGLLVVT